MVSAKTDGWYDMWRC